MQLKFVVVLALLPAGQSSLLWVWISSPGSEQGRTHRPPCGLSWKVLGLESQIIGIKIKLTLLQEQERDSKLHIAKSLASK